MTLIQAVALTDGGTCRQRGECWVLPALVSQVSRKPTEDLALSVELLFTFQLAFVMLPVASSSDGEAHEPAEGFPDGWISEAHEPGRGVH